MDNLQIHLSFLQKCLNQSNKAYYYYKAAQDRIVYFAGTIFISIITITGIFGADKLNNYTYNYGWYLLVLFHSLFFILYLFYFHKMLISEVHLITSMEIQNAIQRLLKLNKSEMPDFIGLKNRFIGDSLRIKALKGGLSPGRIANVLILLVYFFTTLCPFFIFQLQIKEKPGIVISSNAVIILITVLFLVLFVIVNNNLNKRRRRINREVRAYLSKQIHAFISKDLNIGDLLEVL